MSAGLPGLGLGGLFFIFSALLAPLRQLWRCGKGQSEPAQWRKVGRQFAQALTMVIAIDATLRLVCLALAVVGAADASSAASGTVIPLMPMGLTTGVLAAVLAAAKVADLVMPARSEEVAPPGGAERRPGDRQADRRRRAGREGDRRLA